MDIHQATTRFKVAISLVNDIIEIESILMGNSMNGPSMRYWSRGSSRNVVSGILIGLGILCAVVTQFFFVCHSTVGYSIGIGLFVAGVVGLFTKP
jgi:hypothetical protein